MHCSYALCFMRKKHAQTTIEKPYESVSLSPKYKTCRPGYPPEVHDRIFAYCDEGGASYDTCLDVGCGTGRSTKPLVDRYDLVYGLDSSSSQISEAKSGLPTVRFRVEQAENLDFWKDGSVDLVTIAGAFHWFKNPKRYYRHTYMIYVQCIDRLSIYRPEVDLLKLFRCIYIIYVISLHDVEFLMK